MTEKQGWWNDIAFNILKDYYGFDNWNDINTQLQKHIIEMIKDTVERCKAQHEKKMQELKDLHADCCEAQKKCEREATLNEVLEFYDNPCDTLPFRIWLEGNIKKLKE
jgi:hypothetical protein